MLVPAECVPVALLLGMALGYAIRTEKTRIVYQENRRLRRALRRKPARIDEGKHFARRPHPAPAPRPALPRPDQLPPLGPVAAFPDPPLPRPRKLDDVRPDGTASPLTSVAHAYDHYRRRVFVVPTTGVDHHTDTAELAAVTA